MPVAKRVYSRVTAVEASVEEERLGPLGGEVSYLRVAAKTIQASEPEGPVDSSPCIVRCPVCRAQLRPVVDFKGPRYCCDCPKFQ